MPFQILVRGCVFAAEILSNCRRRGDSGQTTAEYALVIVGAATVALLLLTWATGSGRISSLFNSVVDTVADMVT